VRRIWPNTAGMYHGSGGDKNADLSFWDYEQFQHRNADKSSNNAEATGLPFDGERSKQVPLGFRNPAQRKWFELLFAYKVLH
jgi:hypothetical protein